MKNILPFLFLFSLLNCNNRTKINSVNNGNILSYIDTNNSFLDTVITDDILNKKNNSHVNITGTRIFIIPPKGFNLDNQNCVFYKYKDGKASTIQFNELANDRFEPFSRNKFLKDKETTIKIFSDIKVNKYSGLYIETKDKVMNVNNLYLLFGDSSFSVAIMTTSSEEDTLTLKEIKQAIKTIYFDQNLKIDPYANAIFSLDDSKSRYKLTTSITNNSYIYTKDHLVKENYSFLKDDFFGAMQLQKNDVDIKKLRMQGLDKYKELGAQEINITEPSIHKLGQVIFSEIEVTFILQQKKLYGYFAIAEKGEQKIIFSGVCSHDDRNICKQDFKTLAYSIKFK